MLQTDSLVSAVRKTIESAYTDTMTVFVMAGGADGLFDDKSEQISIENEPCRVSYKTDLTVSRAAAGDGAADNEQSCSVVRS